MTFYEYYFSELFNPRPSSTDFEEVSSVEDDIPVTMLYYGEDRFIKLRHIDDGDGIDIEFGVVGKPLGYLTGEMGFETVPAVISRVFGYLYKHKLSPSFLQFSAERDESKDGLRVPEYIYTALLTVIPSICSDFPIYSRKLDAILSKVKSRKRFLMSDLGVLMSVGISGDSMTNDERFGVLVRFGDMDLYSDASARGNQYVRVLNKLYNHEIEGIDIDKGKYTIRLKKPLRGIVPLGKSV